jgi:hypothetical protein
VVARTARRRWLKAAVFRPGDSARSLVSGRLDLRAALAIAGGAPDGVGSDGGFPDMTQLPRAVTGTVLDVSPHILILGNATDERRITLAADSTAWRGGRLEPTALHPGDHAVVRLRPSARNVADRIWANIGRVTGKIVSRSHGQLLVDQGTTKPRQVVQIPPGSSGRIEVRFPTLQPGYLIDVIGIRREDALEALIPATSQPSYPAHRPPGNPLISGRSPDAITGSATWREPADEPPGMLGVAYPALDPETRCAEEEAAADRMQGAGRMPYLAIGSILLIRNDCTGSSCMLPVTGCMATGRLFNDRCVTCGTSPRGRVAELTLASFVALGGELEQGCFNATIKIGH